MPNESLPVSTATDVYIYSRINVHCLEHDIKYNWTIRKTNLVGADLEVVNYTNPLGTNTGTFLVTNGSFAAGYYKIELNVTLSSTYFHEYTYMTFKDPLPFSYISGGSTRTVSSNTQSYEFDATFSHDGKGERGNIRFTWTCKKYAFLLVFFFLLLRKISYYLNYVRINRKVLNHSIFYFEIMYFKDQSSVSFW